VSVHEAGADFSRDHWQLFDIEADPTESKDLAATNTAKLAELQRLWQREAARYGDLPLREAPPSRRSTFVD
jgi:arylsulfatase